jgi:alpha-tubulin suppressor-like RCC1 family protein
MRSFFGTLVFLFFSLSVEAQVFIPFSFWANQQSPLAISDTLLYLNPGAGWTFSATGGTGNYTWSNTLAASTDGSTIDGTAIVTADYTARLTSYQTDVVTLSDGANSVSASVVTYDPLSISPSSLVIAINGTQTFTATGGCLNGTNCVGGTRTFSVTGVGSINSGGLYTAPATSGTALVEVSDSIGNVASANVTVVSSLTIVPSSLKLPVYSTNTFTAVLGSLPYTFSVFSGSGSIVAATGVYTAASATGSAVVRVKDNINSTSDSAVTIIKPVDIKVGQYFACALYNEGSVKCWGANTYGQLGIGSTATIGDVNTEVGGANQFVDLGTGRTASSISVGLYHACALLDNSTIKCWGMGTYGQLGQGNVNNLGDGPSEMGDNLASISLGTGRTATAVYAFGYTTCAKLDNNALKCWGRNTGGMLGQGNANNLGDGANEMGDNLTAINLGTGRTASKVSGGIDFTCALLDNSTVKCWGSNQKGQLGKDNQTSLGDNAGEMGYSLKAVNIGTGRTATDIASGQQYTCVKRDNNTEICWGRNIDGQCGIGAHNGQDRDVGDVAGDMAALAGINFATGFGTLSKIFVFGFSACSIDGSNVIKCWGRNAEGELEYGNTTLRDAPINTVVNLGSSLVVSKMSGGAYTICALFTNDRIKCWGRGTDAGGTASNGIFLTGSAANLGDGAGETGDSLSFVNH